MTELSVEKIVAEMERAHAGCPAALHWYTLAEDLRALIADWRKRGDERDSLEKELDVLSASHKDLAHRLARMGEALKEIRDADQTEMALDPGWPSRIARAALEGMGPLLIPIWRKLMA